MGMINAAHRNALPSNEFALPEQRKYPVDTKARAANAKARATQAVNAGRMSPTQAAKIKARANQVLKKGK